MDDGLSSEGPPLAGEGFTEVRKDWEMPFFLQKFRAVDARKRAVLVKDLSGEGGSYTGWTIVLIFGLTSLMVC